jgi:antitoxin (DNA-binding transcriptional repressor) of toxin-antitoxin stability system
MERIGLGELTQNTGQIVARVGRGEVIEVTDGERAVARLVPVEDDRSTLARLVGAGRAVAPIIGRPIPPPPQIGDRTVEVAADLASREERW